MTGSGVVRRKAGDQTPIAQMYLDSSRIRNLAFEKVLFEDVDPDDADPRP